MAENEEKAAVIEADVLAFLCNHVSLQSLKLFLEPETLSHY
jgi:hypothetical protein